VFACGIASVAGNEIMIVALFAFVEFAVSA
jgi:hypothetical protein